MINEIEFQIPLIENKLAGVYAIIFDDTHTYIGSSKDLKIRFTKWVNVISKNKPTNKQMFDIFPTTKSVRFEIVELEPDYIKRYSIERKYISNLGGLYKNILNEINAPTPNKEKYWNELLPIREDGLLYFPTKRGFAGQLGLKIDYKWSS